MYKKNLVIESINGFKDAFEEEGLFIVIDKSGPGGDENPVMEVHFPNEDYDDDEFFGDEYEDGEFSEEEYDEEDMFSFSLKFLESENEENKHGHLLLFFHCPMEDIELEECDILELINALNHKCNIGFFTYDADSKLVTYRHTFQTNIDEVTPPDVILEELPEIVLCNELFIMSVADLISEEDEKDIDEIVNITYNEIINGLNE